MWKTRRFILLYISFRVIQVHSKDPVSLKQIKLIARNEKPLVVYMDPRNHLIKYNDDESKGREIKETISDHAQTRENDIKNLLADLLANLNKYYDGEDGEEYESDDDERTLEETAKEQAKYIFYNFLRTSPDEDPDLQDTRQLLRQALRSRCQKVNNCAKNCEVFKPTCPYQCQKIYDVENLCEPPKCKKSSCGRGKTMPPKWLL